jgi:hypothetical protein
MAANVVSFDMNVPVQLAVKYARPQLFSTANGQRARFSCVDGRTLFLDPEVAASIPQMGIRPHELFNICLRAGERGQAKRWDIWKNGASASASPAPEAAASNPKEAASVSHSVAVKSLAHLQAQTEAIIDLFASCCRYANEKHGDVVSRDDVRALLMQRLISGGRR